MTGKVTAVVVDDSQFMRTTITDILETGGISVVGTAADGREGVRTVVETGPDVVTMDVEMPGTDGIEAVERIMAERPTPILMLSAHTGAEASVTFEALERGAIDFFEKPSGEVSVGLSRSEEQLVETVRTVAAATPAPASESTGGSGGSRTADSAVPENATLVVGASTGGPNVVERLLCGVPPDFRVLVVQHMPDSFTAGFAERLDDQTDYRVTQAENGDRIGAGEALVAPGDAHMEVTGYRRGRLRVGLVEDASLAVCPAIDVTMCSVADHVADPLVAAVLTGMGDDGSEGVQAIESRGGSVVAQDEATSAVFGMPQRAIETGSVDDVRPASELADGVLEAVADDTHAGATREVSRNG